MIRMSLLLKIIMYRIYRERPEEMLTAEKLRNEGSPTLILPPYVRTHTNMPTHLDNIYMCVFFSL